ncbi:MAG: hypothetical protein IH991_07105 [Planctomycetes bacterium]|nr:hypothetical protein [Planctomycetota bacterium]
MDRLVCWLLMGARSGPMEVWFQLGSFATEPEAQEAAAREDWKSQGITKVDVVPYYRVEPDRLQSVPKKLRSDERRGTTKATAV